jgi:FAD/FMN-containing dehydrogenase
MLDFNKIISLDTKDKSIEVQPGVTCEQIQNYTNSYGYAVKVMQASNVFTVGGSLGSNIHGNDPNYGTIIETVKSFDLMRADGSIVNVSREENPELFNLVIGGYGLFGVIIDIDLELTDNVIYEMKSEVMDYKDFPDYFRTHILNDENVGLFSAKISNAPSSFLKQVVATPYTKAKEKKDEALLELQQENYVGLNKFIFGLSRRYDWGKDLSWSLEKKLIAKVGRVEYISRNNAMRPMIEFLQYYSPKNTDILQEYFVPMDKFVEFVDGLREIVKKDRVNLLCVTVRYVPQDIQSFLPYAKHDVFSLVLYINQGLDDRQVKKARTWTREMVNLALNDGGTYYLPYQLYPTKEELLRSYPEFSEFIKKKQTYDPDGLFLNRFYENYINIR